MSCKRDPDKQLVQVWMDKKYVLQLEAEAARLGVKRSDVVLKAVREHLKLDPIPATAAQFDEVKNALVALITHQQQLPQLIQENAPVLPDPGRKLTLRERITGKAES